MSTTLSERLRVACELIIPKKGMFNELAKISGVPGANWKSWWYGRQRPTAEMIEAVCQACPHFALWVVAGVDAPEFAQESPLAPRQDSITGKEAPELVRAKHYLGTRVRAKKGGDDLERMMVQQESLLVKAELLHFFEIADE